MSTGNKSRYKQNNRSIADKSSRSNSNTYIMYGKHPVFSAIQNKKRIIRNVFCLDKVYHQHKENLQSVNVKIVDTQFLRDKISDDINHQGIIAIVEKLPSIRPETLISQNTPDRIIILDQITDPQNIGAITRSAAAFGINKIILPENGSPEENATIAKAASGCLELVTFAKVINISKFLGLLKKNGYWIAGLDGGGSDEISKAAETDKLAIIIGSEGKGLRRLTIENCDFVVKIPIADNVESLNASCAASIILYTLTRHP